MDDGGDADDANDDATGKVFQVVTKTGNSATLVISGSQSSALFVAEPEEKIEWPKYRNQNFAV